MQPILTHKRAIISVFWLSVVLGVLALTWAAQTQTRSLYFLIGSWTAKASVITYLLSLVPGIIKRFDLQTLLQPILLPLMTFRRQIGILSFLTAFYHFVFSYALLRWPKVSAIVLPQRIDNLLGWVALHFLFVLFITSNDWGIKNLGTWWHKLHNLTHVIIWFILVHVVLKTGVDWLAIMIGVTGGLNILSFGYKYLRKTNDATQGVV